ncbi:MAG TPA: EAL domain-containing protein [Allosphingosinicella sp.]|uniref:putative bifunctional diguanylate cyclase/phosphodiesterase n=1 Tax=Allosphingosinicella sp. TaxID=2823234 RepID=UPI002ED83A58
MLKERLQKFGNAVLSVLAGFSSFVFTLMALLVLRELDEKILAAITMGTFALLITWIASERPNSGQGRAIKALIDRLLAVKRGDLSSPAPKIVRKQLPALATAVDALFDQVRSNLDDVRAMAMYDPVTSLPNRLYFKREGETVLEARQPAERAALLFIDLDGFKEVNDSFGHAQGDQVLASVANRLRLLVTEQAEPGRLSQPIIARLAGDEFTLLFPSVVSTEEARSIAEKVLAELSEPFAAGTHSVSIGASIGVALCPNHGTDLASLMKAADIAMYHAKASGRSQVCVYNEELAIAFAGRLETERALREALARDEFTLAYQPQVCARSGEVVAGEALLRWNHPTRGTLLPGSFIPIAEESTLIGAIGDWVIDAVIEALGRWKAAGATQRLTFNVSPGQAERPGFFARLREKIEETGSPPWLLELEFTETMAMQCSDNVIAELAALRADGVSIAIDDFGSGYSNLARMKDMPIDRVKLDRSLISDIDSSENARTIIAAVIHLIHGLGLEVVAEGVERKDQIDVLRAVGCDTFQGHAFAEAMPEERFFEWLRQGQPDAKSA